MVSFICMQIIFAVASITSAQVETRDPSNTCGKIKQQMATNQTVSSTSDVIKCISDCYSETIKPWFRTTAATCFNDLVKPYITKVLKKQIPSSGEIEKCLNAKDRSLCKDTLLYYFAKWYKDKYSADYSRRFAIVLFHTWVGIPDMRKGIKSWKVGLGNALAFISYDSDPAIQEAIKTTSVSDPLQYPVIHRELKRYCDKPIRVEDTDTKRFCQIRIYLNIAAKISTLANGKQKYGNSFQKYVRAAKSNFIPLSIMVGRSHAGNDEQNTLALDQQLNELTDLTRGGNTKKLQTFLQFLPEPYLLEQACKKKRTSPIVGQRCCILEEVVEQLLLYSNMMEKRKKKKDRKAVTINFSLNLRSVITELRGEEVIKMIRDSRYQSLSNQEATERLIEGKFGQLKVYFSKLQSFNMQKANADVGYVKARINYYQGRLQAAIDDVSNQVGGILRGALITQGLEVGEKVIKLTLAIVEACNPFKAVFNGGTATDIMDATAELMQAISNLAQATSLKNAWTEVIQTVKNISTGFQRNSEFLSAVGRIVAKVKIKDFPNDEEFEQCKSTFLRLYNAYSPKVDKQMLAVLATRIETSVTTGCELINAATGSAANGYVAYVKKNLFCQKATVSTSSLKTIFEEIYDFQFEFIENMASYLRAATGYQASKQMISLARKPIISTGNATKKRSELKAKIIMAHTVYEMQRQGVIENLCNFLEYKEGGMTPAVCKGADLNIPTLLSYIPKRCKSVTTFVSIPIASATIVEPGEINITRLYSGEEVPFEIPNYDWMKQSSWIDQDENFDAIYIKNFEVFLPTINQGKKKVKVTVRSMGGNRFQDGGTKYTLIPSESFRLVYSGGNRYYPCSGEKIENPYNICEDRKLPTLCVMSNTAMSDDTKVLFPSAFSRFAIKATGVVPQQVPEPQTPLDIKGKVTMCILANDSTSQKRSSVQSKAGCCSGNNYWNEAKGKCAPCARGSMSALNGYYCNKSSAH